jgi:hypothetical protein
MVEDSDNRREGLVTPRRCVTTSSGLIGQAGTDLLGTQSVGSLGETRLKCKDNRAVLVVGSCRVDSSSLFYISYNKGPVYHIYILYNIG